MLALVVSPDSEERVELREVEAPTPAPNEVMVRVRAFSLNRGEVTRIAAATEGDRFGWDIAGEIAQTTADGSGPPVGTRVVGFVQGRGWAEYVAVPVLRVAPIPDELSFAQASSLPVAGLTALRTLRIGGLLMGKRVLITGASGGVGRFAVQLATMEGAEVTALAGSEERARGLKDLGADRIALKIE